MGSMDGWDVALLMAAGYVAATALVRLMIRHRDQLLNKFREEVKREKKRRAIEERRREIERSRAA